MGQEGRANGQRGRNRVHGHCAFDKDVLGVRMFITAGRRGS